MVFLKVIKDKAYHKRYQTKFRRRREGKTDFYARKRLVAQAKNKYNTHKYRFIVRITNRDIICQVAYATVTGDMIMAAAYSHELPRYGVPLGLTNYAAAYATGLLLARRILAKLGLGTRYRGVDVVTGEDFNVAPIKKGPSPFTCILDVGLARTSTGSRIFAALKGMCDGGVRVPHSDRRFVGYNAAKKELDPAVLRKYIFGGHVSAYMALLQEKQPEKYKTHFSRYIAQNIKPSDIEKMYKEAHQKIRRDPKAVKKVHKEPTAEEKKKFARPVKRTLAQRKAAVKAKKRVLHIPL